MLWLSCNLFTVRAKRTRLNQCHTQLDYVWLSCVVFIVWLSAYCYSLLCPNVTSEEWHVKVLLQVQKCTLQREEFVFLWFLLQVQADSQTCHLAHRTVDLCQVQIWPSTCPLRDHPQPHAGSWPGGKASTDTLSVSLSLLFKPQFFAIIIWLLFH